MSLSDKCLMSSVATHYNSYLHSAVREIVEDIRQGSGQHYGSEMLSELFKMLPETEEVLWSSVCLSISSGSI